MIVSHRSIVTCDLAYVLAPLPSAFLLGAFLLDVVFVVLLPSLLVSDARDAATLAVAALSLLVQLVFVAVLCEPWCAPVVTSLGVLFLLAAWLRAGLAVLQG